jgi:hypothetical protein
MEEEADLAHYIQAMYINAVVITYMKQMIGNVVQ